MHSARFQHFTTVSRPDLSASRIAGLRADLKARKLHGLLLPRADIFQGEYLPPSEDRLAWLTGFSGSAGFCIVLEKRAALFVDGRYTAQAKAELDRKVVQPLALASVAPEKWLEAHVRKGGTIGYDSALFTERGLAKFREAAERSGFVLSALASDPFDAIWPDRPAAPATSVVPHEIGYAGIRTAEKLKQIENKLDEARLDALVISECPSVNWLFNIRAGDVPHLPILRAFALIERGKAPRLYADRARFTPEALTSLDGIVEIVQPSSAPNDGRVEIGADLERLTKSGSRIRLDVDTAPALFSEVIVRAGGKPSVGADPIALLKAQKNPAELAGTRAAHTRDGAAMVRFLAWLESALKKGPVTEIDAVIALENERIASGALVDISFATIAGAGPNAALPHYRVTEKTNRPISPGLFLIDSGGQYRDGTTDITRTLAVGTPTRAMKDAYTRVLKGMIAISRCVFPVGTSGAQIDALARQFLWSAGKDFDHGTGHGVGSFLSVHEGPQRISKFGTTGLLPGMILSNEPGYYREGKFGIRIENLVAVEQHPVRGGEREMLGFQTLTWCPIDTRPVIRSMLTREERAWLNRYHSETEARLAPLLEGEPLTYLRKACAPL